MVKFQNDDEKQKAMSNFNQPPVQDMRFLDHNATLLFRGLKFIKPLATHFLRL